MQLDSVRNLKETLSRTLHSQRIMTFRSYLVETHALDLEPSVPRTLALGVVQKNSHDFLLAVRLQDRAAESSGELEIIRKKAKGEVEVRYIGRVSKRAAAPWYRQRQRPLRIGCSVGHYKITAGTLGAFVRIRGGGGVHLLSNNHVLANENRAKKGDVILQPGVYDGGKHSVDAIASLTEFVRLKHTGKNGVDAAIAQLESGVQYDFAKLTGLGKLKGLGDAFLDEGSVVAKVGRTTGLTRGRVTAFELDNIVINYDVGRLTFDNQIEIEGLGEGPFSAGGDSGSLIVGKDLLAVGLLYAGSDQGGSNGQGLTYANPLHVVLNTLHLELAL
jgi:hypothetical protein